MSATWLIWLYGDSHYFELALCKCALAVYTPIAVISSEFLLASLWIARPSIIRMLRCVTPSRFRSRQTRRKFLAIARQLHGTVWVESRAAQIPVVDFESWMPLLHLFGKTNMVVLYNFYSAVPCKKTRVS